MGKRGVRIADGAPRRARPIDPGQLPLATRTPSGRPPAPWPPPRPRSGRCIDRHTVGDRHRLACERGLRDIQALRHERARPHPQHPPASAKRSGAPRPLGQIHPGAIGGRQPDRGAAVERAEVDPGRVRRAECREQKPAAVRQKLRREVADLPRAERCHRGHHAPRGGHAHQGASRNRSKDDDTVRAPRRAATGSDRRECLRRAAAKVEPLQRVPGHEADRPAVGRPEGPSGPLGSRQRPRRGRCKRPQPQLGCAVTRGREDDLPAVGREGKVRRAGRWRA